MPPAIRAAEAAQEASSLRRYEHDPNADAFGLESAEKLGVPPERVFKDNLWGHFRWRCALAAV